MTSVATGDSLLVDAVPEGASEAQAEDAILLALMGHDAEIHALYEQVRKLARDKGGYLRERMEEDNPYRAFGGVSMGDGPRAKQQTQRALISEWLFAETRPV